MHEINTIVAPEHLSSIRAICTRFRKARKTILLWHEEGAPIAYDGAKYCAEYNQLQNWLVQRSKTKKV